MTTIHPQFIRAGNDEFVVTRAEFDVLMAITARENDEAGDVAIFNARMAELRAGAYELLPAEVSRFMLEGDGLPRAIRRWKGVSEAELSEKTGLSRAEIDAIDAIENGITEPADALRSIAAALGVDPAWLV